MSPSRKLHRQAMAATDQADLCRRQGDIDGEKLAWAEALKLELAAIAALPGEAEFARNIMMESAEAIRLHVMRLDGEPSTE